MNPKIARLIRRAASRAGVHARPLRRRWDTLDAREKLAMRRDLERYLAGVEGTAFGAAVEAVRVREEWARSREGARV